jgi:hypothetical protein
VEEHEAAKGRERGATSSEHELGLDRRLAESMGILA